MPRAFVRLPAEGWLILKNLVAFCNETGHNPIMKRKEWLETLQMARNPAFEPTPYLELNAFIGCTLDNKRRAVTMHEVASMVFGHCATFAGTWLHAEEAELEILSKRFDLVG